MTIESINHKITYVGLPPKAIYFAWINITNFIILELWKIHSCLLKSRGAEDCLKTRVELKLFESKLDFWNLFEKLECRWFVWKWGSWELNLRIGNLEAEFERERNRKLFGNQKPWKFYYTNRNLWKAFESKVEFFWK